MNQIGTVTAKPIFGPKRGAKQPVVPEISEWDFSSVTGEQLPFALTWEYSRESDKIRTRILKWLDSKNSRGQTVRETKAARFNHPPQEFDPKENCVIRYLSDEEKRHISEWNEDAGLSIPPIDWGFAHATSRRLPPSNRPRWQAILWELLYSYGHEFPKPWTQFHTENRHKYFTSFRSDPVHWEPANYLLGYYNRKETAENFERMLSELRLSETSKQLGGLWHFAWLMTRNLHSMAKLEEMLDRAWLLEVDLATTPKDKFLSEMERFWDQQVEIFRRERRKRRKVKGQAGRLPWSDLTWLAASRLRKTLSIVQSEVVVKFYQNRDSGNEAAAQRLGVVNLVPLRKPSLPDQTGKFTFPQYSKPQSWTESVQKFRRKIKAFEREILPYFT
jgi:hypothetical protein